MRTRHAGSGRRACIGRNTAQLRHQLAAGELTLADVMREQPAALGDRALFEILLMARGIGRARLCELNRRAFDDAVNLAVALKDADANTRRWVAANALRRSPLGAWDQLML
jgi:hypothetical protein